MTRYYIPMVLKECPDLDLPEGVTHLLPVYTDRAALRRDYGHAVEVMEFRAKGEDDG